MSTKRKSMNSEPDDFNEAVALDPLEFIIEEIESSPKKMRIPASTQINNFTSEEKELIFGKFLFKLCLNLPKIQFKLQIQSKMSTAD